MTTKYKIKSSLDDSFRLGVDYTLFQLENRCFDGKKDPIQVTAAVSNFIAEKRRELKKLRRFNELYRDEQEES